MLMSLNTMTHWIEPLSGNNYHAWWQKMEWILTDLDLWDHVTAAESQLKL